jgi:integrase/recombinase XerD
MLSLYRRHKAECQHRANIHWKRCKCLVWCQGLLRNEYHRKSLNTQSWETGELIIREWDKRGKAETKPQPVTLEQAADAFLQHCADAGFRDRTLYRHRVWLARFNKWAAGWNYKFLSEIDTHCLRDYIHRKPDYTASTRFQTRQELSVWIVYCVSQGWLTENPLKDLPKIKVRRSLTQPLSDGEYAALLAGCQTPESRAFVLLLRWSGLRLSDGVSLERTAIDARGRLTKVTGKTHTDLNILLPPFVIDALRAIPATGRRFFMPDAGDVLKGGAQYRRLISKIDIGDGKRAYPHQLRDTAAVSWLLAGVPIDQVARLLGHKSIRTTEQHYSPWIQERQRQSGANAMAAWPNTSS